MREQEADEQISIDMGEEYDTALSSATQEEIIDLAGTYIQQCCLETYYMENLHHKTTAI